MSNGMKKVEGDRNTTLTHDFIVGHKYEVVVRAVGPDGTEQAMENAARNTIVIAGKITEPTTPIALAASGFLESISLVWTNSPDYDFDHMEVWRSAINKIDTALKIAEVKGITYLDVIGVSNATRYYWIRAMNTSGETSNYYPGTTAGVSGTTLGVVATDIDDFAVTASKMFTNTIILSGDVWTNNSPGAGSVAWNAHNLVYGGNYYLVAAGNAALRYITWTVGNTGGFGTVADPYLTTYASAASYVYATSRYNVAVNEGGINQLVWNSSANMVIGSAFILDAAIIEAKIGNLAVTTGKIADCNVDKLTAGIMTSKYITLATVAGVDCYINAGKTQWDNTQAGFILGIDNTTAKFYIGDATTYMNWTGAGLVVKGGITITSGSGIANLADAGGLSILDVVGDGEITDMTASKLTAGTISSEAITLSVVEGAGDVYIRAGKLTFASTTAGFILGIDDADSNRPKFHIGDATNYVYFNGVSLAVRGTLNADDVVAGTLTGRTVQTASSGQRIVLDQSDNTMRLKNTAGDTLVLIDDSISGSIPGIIIEHSTYGGIFRAKKDASNYASLSYAQLAIICDGEVNNVIYIVDGATPKFTVSSIGNLDTQGTLTTHADSVRVAGTQSPASNGAGVTGEIAWDATYLYVCTAANTWKRVELTGGY